MPEYAYLYAIPYDLYSEYGVRRYGFHGISHRYVTEQAAKKLKKPYEQCALLSAHLGNGCSVTAVLNGKSIDTWDRSLTALRLEDQKLFSVPGWIQPKQR